MVNVGSDNHLTNLNWTHRKKKLRSFRQYTNFSSKKMLLHDDVIKWKRFPRNWPFVRGIHRSPVNSPHKGQWRGAFTFSLICVWITGWVNNCDAGDLRRYHAHYDVIVMENVVWMLAISLRSQYTKVRKHSPMQWAFSLVVLFCCHGSQVDYRIGSERKSPPFRSWYFQVHFREWNFCILIKISLKFVSEGPVENNTALV